jgi:hypothetical protein
LFAGKWLRAPATSNGEGLADAGAANPFALPRNYPGIGAFHEAGHALAHARLRFPFYSVSIIPHDGMKGYVHMLEILAVNAPVLLSDSRIRCATS